MRGFGGPEVLEYADVRDPVPGPDDILIDIHAVSVNPADWKVREGLRKKDVRARFPHILGEGFLGRRPRSGSRRIRFSAR